MSTTEKKREFRTGFVNIFRVLGTEVAQKGVLWTLGLGSLLFIIFTFIWQHDQLVGVCSGRLKKGGLSLGLGQVRCGHSSKKWGLGCGSN